MQTMKITDAAAENSPTHKREQQTPSRLANFVIGDPFGSDGAPAQSLGLGSSPRMFHFATKVPIDFDDKKTKSPIFSLNMEIFEPCTALESPNMVKHLDTNRKKPQMRGKISHDNTGKR